MKPNDLSGHWYSRHRIIKERILLGVTGAPLRNKEMVQKHMEKLKSYCERHNSKGQITHFVSLEDIRRWNQQIEKNLKKINRPI